MRIEEKAWAKVNISLDVQGLLPGGYHRMEMLMQTVSLHDDVELRLTPEPGVRLSTGAAFLPTDDGNIAVRAAKRFLEEAGDTGRGVEISLTKRIPVCAGLGGGSADGAAVLRGLNSLFGGRFSRSELEAMAASVGSDIPFCVAGGTQHATGTGTTLRDIVGMPDCALLICKPEFFIRTPELFARIDSRRSRLHPDTAGIIAAIEGGDLPGVARRMYNVFEDVLPRRCGEIARLKGRLLDTGALGSVMSGTGSALFGIFESPEQAEKARSELSGECPNTWVARCVERYLD